MTAICNIRKRNRDVERSGLNKYCIVIGQVGAVSKDTHPAALSIAVAAGEAAAGVTPGQSVLMERRLCPGNCDTKCLIFIRTILFVIKTI